MKTSEMWETSGLTFTNFAQPGDVVCERIVDYFFNVLPPRVWYPNRLVQVGEAINVVNGRTTYITFAKNLVGTELKWIYCGCCHHGKEHHEVEGEIV